MKGETRACGNQGRYPGDPARHGAGCGGGRPGGWARAARFGEPAGFSTANSGPLSLSPSLAASGPSSVSWPPPRPLLSGDGQ